MLKQTRKPLNKGNKQLKRTPLASSSKGLARGTSQLKNKGPSPEKKAYRKSMAEFFKQMWENRPHYSEVSGTWLSGFWLGRQFLGVFQHHILAKEVYPEFAFEPENIIFLTPEEHNRVEKDDDCFDEVNKRKEKLLKKYEDLFNKA